MPKTRSGKKSGGSVEKEQDETAARLKTVREGNGDDDDEGATTSPLATQPAVDDVEEMQEEQEDADKDNGDDGDEEQEEKKPKVKGSPASVAEPIVEDEEARGLTDKHIFDLMDYQQEIIIADRESRAKLFGAHQVRKENGKAL